MCVFEEQNLLDPRFIKGVKTIQKNCEQDA